MTIIPTQSIDEVRQRADIVEVVSGYIPLKKAGVNYKALCPFHEEKTPSFNVNPDKNIFHCFGCGEGGDSIGFVMKYEGITFPEAVRMLAKTYGVAIQERAGGAKPGVTENIYKAMQAAAEFYIAALEKAGPGSKPAGFLDDRGVSQDMAQLFKIGWAPDQWDALTKALLGRGFDKKILESAGLSKTSSRGSLIDRFRARVIFPICDMQGRPIAFGGRILDESQTGPKYLNSPETQIYNKSRVLYGLNLAAQPARKKGRLVLVEGYMDVIALQGAGIENCAAVSGTAFTTGQAEAIKRICDTAVAFFDSDDAGVAAAKKSLPTLLDRGLKTHVMTLPGAKDADEYLQAHGPEELERLLGQAPTFAQYIIETAVGSNDMSTVEGRAQSAREAMPFINRIQDRLERDQYLQILAEKTGLDLKLLASEANAQGGTSARRASQKSIAKPVNKKQGARNIAERILIRILLECPEYLNGAALGLDEKDFMDESNRRLFHLVKKAVDEGATGLDGIMSVAQARDMAGEVAKRTMESNLYDEQGSEKVAIDCVRTLKYDPEERKRLLREQMQAAEKIEGVDREKFADAQKEYIKSRKNGLA